MEIYDFLKIGGIVALITFLVKGAGLAIFANLASPLLIGVIVIFFLVWMTKK